MFSASPKLISLSPEILNPCPQLRLGVCQINGLHIHQRSPELGQQIAWAQNSLRKSLDLPAISRINSIAHTRDAYKACGKEPSRYRSSAEALLRRVLAGKDLYTINNVVDLINLISIRYGFSIGGYDADKIDGEVVLTTGNDEPYEAIGRGNLNIHQLPVLADSKGPFGSPTSDSERCKIEAETQNSWLVFFDFGGCNWLEMALQECQQLFAYFTQPEDIHLSIVPAAE